MVGWPHHSQKYRPLDFNDALNVTARCSYELCCQSLFDTVWLCDAARVKDPHFTLSHHRVGFKSHLGLGFFRVPSGFIVMLFIYWLLIFILVESIFFLILV